MPTLIYRVNMIPSSTPQIGMKFNSTNEAWEFWTYYRGRMGFDVRINYKNKSKMDGVITSAGYICYNQGYRAKEKRE
jgi:zinc finger SWIM domain-containing protein 3